MLAQGFRLVQAISKLGNLNDPALTFVDHERVIGLCDRSDEVMDEDAETEKPEQQP